MGQLHEGTEAEEQVEQEEASAITADDFVQPGDEDFNDEVLHESIEETIERTKKAVSEAEKDDSGEEQPDGGENQEGKAAKESGKAKPEAGQQGLEAPQRTTSDFKEWYKTAPPEMQQQFNKIVKDLEHGQLQKLREIHDYRQTVEPVFQALQPWAKDWSERGISLPQGVALLAKTHERMVEDPEGELARLIQDNFSEDQVEQALHNISARVRGEAPANGSSGTSVGYNQDITKHPEFQSLRNELDLIKNERREAEIASETQKIQALRNEVDADGNKPYEHILNPAFLRYAQPLVTERRTPPRDEYGRFTGAPKSLVDTYKELYGEWISFVRPESSTMASASPQPVQAQPQRQPAEPVSMRPRNAPGNAPVSNDDPTKFRNESVEDTMNRVLAQMRG